MKMPFGKYQDRELGQVPRQYLCWLRGQEWIGDWLAFEIDRVLGTEPDEAIIDEIVRPVSNPLNVGPFAGCSPGFVGLEARK